MKLSIVVPAYNEEKIIQDTLNEFVEFLNSKSYDWELIVVDDGSTDNTSTIVNGIKNKNIRLIELQKNKGKGAALREGFLKAKGEFVIYSDADLSVPIKNIDKFLKEFESGSKVIIGSRRVKGANIEKHQPWLRENMGRVYTLLTQAVTGTKLKDYTCGFKGFEKHAAKKIFGNAIIDRWAYDSEIMFLANKYGYKIKQVPVKWVNREDTRVNLRSVVLESLKDLLMIRVYNLLGRYNKD